MKGFSSSHPTFPSFSWRTHFGVSKWAVSEYRNHRSERSRDNPHNEGRLSGEDVKNGQLPETSKIMACFTPVVI
jgi:hypothetical protein